MQTFIPKIEKQKFKQKYLKIKFFKKIEKLSELTATSAQDFDPVSY